MQVAKFWRNKKLRYRLERMTHLNEREPIVLAEAQKDTAEQNEPVKRELAGVAS